MLLKLLAFIFVLVLIMRSIGYLVRMLFGGGVMGKASREFKEGRQGQPRRSRPSDGNVNIDYVPGKEGKGKKGFKGGDYVDYEEVS
jgi:hypothetical protein